MVGSVSDETLARRWPNREAAVTWIQVTSRAR